MSLFEGYPLALPVHLRDKRHTDWLWPMSRIPRSWNAKGPRCGPGNPGYLPWPPKLVRGRGVTRWENDGASSVIEIPAFAGLMTAAEVYSRPWEAIERNPGQPLFGRRFLVDLHWKETRGWGGDVKPNPDAYSPSALQEYSDGGFMILSPTYRTWFAHKWGREPNIGMGWRPDHVDLYYNLRRIYVGLNFE